MRSPGKIPIGYQPNRAIVSIMCRFRPRVPAAAASGAAPSISGLYLDNEYYLHYPAGMKMTDGVPEEIREVVSTHWDQFAPANPLIPHFFGLMFFFMWIISFLGNGCVIFIFLKVKSLRTPVRT